MRKEEVVVEVDEVVELAIWRLFLNIGLDICSILILRVKPPLILAVLITKSTFGKNVTFQQTVT